MKKNLIIYAFLTFLLINKSYAETSTNTLKQIQGSKPVLSFDNGTALETDLSNLLSFTMPDKQNGLLTIRPDNTKKIIAEPDYTLDQFTTHVIANGDVFSEWGWSQDHGVETTYPNSGWNYGNYWTSEIHIEGYKHFHVTSNSGTIGSGYNNMNYYIFCRG